MVYSIIYLSVAEQDIDDIGAYMSQFYTNTFKNIMHLLGKSIGNLQTLPYLGAPHGDYRKLVVGKYLVLYKVDEVNKTIRIYRVLHGTRDSEVQAGGTIFD